jgi:hypothetical protein
MFRKYYGHLDDQHRKKMYLLPNQWRALRPVVSSAQRAEVDTSYTCSTTFQHTKIDSHSIPPLNQSNSKSPITTKIIEDKLRILFRLLVSDPPTSFIIGRKKKVDTEKTDHSVASYSFFGLYSTGQERRQHCICHLKLRRYLKTPHFSNFRAKL